MTTGKANFIMQDEKQPKLRDLAAFTNLQGHQYVMIIIGSCGGTALFHPDGFDAMILVSPNQSDSSPVGTIWHNMRWNSDWVLLPKGASITLVQD